MHLMINHTETPHAQELTSEFLKKEIEQLSFVLEDIPTNPNEYVIVLDSEVQFNQKKYRLVYKICMPREDTLITKLSLIDSSPFDNSNNIPTITIRHPASSKNLKYSDDDYRRSAEEAAMRYSIVDLSTNPIEARSKIEIDEELRGKGIGKFLFSINELLTSDLATRISAQTIKIILRDDSDPKGWTSAMAEKFGFEKLSPLQSGPPINFSTITGIR